MSEDAGFLSRWSRRKVQARQGALPEPEAPDAPRVAAAPQAAAASAVAPAAVVSAPTPAPDAVTAPHGGDPEPAPPTMFDVEALTRESDFSRFVAPGVNGEVKNAALKKLFTDPHFNVMDGLDIYIDDYGKPDPLPASSLRKMAQAAFLGLVQPDAPSAAAAAPSPPPTAQVPKSAEVEAAEIGPVTPERDEDADLRLQPHDAAGCGGAEDGAAADPRRQS